MHLCITYYTLTICICASVPSSFGVIFHVRARAPMQMFRSSDGLYTYVLQCVIVESEIHSFRCDVSESDCKCQLSRKSGLPISELYGLIRTFASFLPIDCYYVFVVQQ